MSRLAANYPLNWASTANDSNAAGATFDILGQTFTTGSAGPYAITSIDIPMSGGNALFPGGLVTVEIYAVDGLGNPSGSILSSGTYDLDGMINYDHTQLFSTISINVTLSACALASSTTYIITIYPDMDIVPDEGVRWYGTTTTGYSSGTPRKHTTGGTWSTDVLVGDYGFRLWADDAGGDLPVKPTVVSPSNAGTGISLTVATLDWARASPVGVDETYNLYFGTESGNLDLIVTGISDTEYATPLVSDDTPLSYNTTYYWRVDAVNVYGTTTGDEWSFTTLVFDYPTLSAPILYRRLVAVAGSAFWYEDI